MSGRKNKEFDDLAKYLPWMTDCARRLVSVNEAKDLVAMALLDAQTPTKPPPPAEDENRVKAWLWTLLRFRAFGVWRTRLNQSIETPLDDDYVDALAVAEAPDWETTIENRQWLQLALNELSEEQRNLVIECDIEEVSLAQLSRTSGISENTLRTRLRRAHDQMRATLIGLCRSRLRALFPFLFLRCLAPNDVENVEPWTQRIRRALQQVVRQPLQFGANLAAVACVLGLTSGSPCAKDQPLDMAIAAEPIASITAESAPLTVEVFPGTNAGQAEPTSTQTPSVRLATPKKNAVAPREEFTSDEDDRLLMRAKAALNRRDAKSALELLAEHERRFPNSKNAERREFLRAQSMRVAKAQR